MLSKNNHCTFTDKLSFENLSSLLNDLGIMTHSMTNKQNVCIEHPNINIENKNIFETQKDSDNLSDEEKNIKKTLDNEYTLNIAKYKTYIINPTKLYNEFNKKNPYSIEEFKNSLKIFVSIFNCFNEDLFKWNLEDFNLFNNDNKIQIFNFNKDNINIKINESIEELYQKHFSVQYDYEKADIIEIFTSQNSNDSITKTNNDDFVDDFDLSYRISINKNIINKSLMSDNKDGNLYCYEKDNIFRNIYFIMYIFNLMNNFILLDYNIDNILKNIDLLNSNIINDYKFLLLISFNITIQINLFINKYIVNSFLNINNNIPSQKNSINNDNKMINIFNPNIHFIDYQNKEIAKDEKELIKERIIFLNIILKLFNLTYFYKNNINIKINIKILSIDFFHDIKTKLFLPENIFYNINGINNIFDFIKTDEFTGLFFSNNNSKNIFSIVTFELILLKDVDINQLNELTKIYYSFITNSDFVSFDTLENDSLIKYPLINYLNELSILIWALKFISKIAKLNMQKLAFTFVFNSFSIALKKDITDKNNNINILDLMIYMGIYHYN